MRRFLPGLLEDSARDFGNRLNRVIEHRLKQLIKLDDQLNLYEAEIAKFHH